MSKPESTVRVHFECHKHGEVHVLCVKVPRPVPPQLECEAAAPAGYSTGPGAGCIPADLAARVSAVLDRGMGQWVRLGHVEVGA